MTSIAMPISSFSLPVLSAKAPNNGDDITASSIGRVLTKPERVGSMPCICIKVGENASMASRTRLKRAHPARNSRVFGLNRAL